MDQPEIIQLMTAKHLFEGASPEELGSLVDHGEVLAVPDGELLIEQGKIGEAVWILLDGVVTIFVDGAESHQLDTPGTILGEISAVSRIASTASVKATGEVSALRISHESLHLALSSSQKLAESVLRSMTKYL
ncbi:MAG: cyclic nucleotide-binding domain-containing protein [Verrucomicrobiales bacterium]|nr:cyclic nucleotide-binding domain-containing protein [Verrucomicrobiales bacterium]